MLRRVARLHGGPARLCDALCGLAALRSQGSQWPQPLPGQHGSGLRGAPAAARSSSSSFKGIRSGEAAQEEDEPVTPWVRSVVSGSHLIRSPKYNKGAPWAAGALGCRASRHAGPLWDSCRSSPLQTQLGKPSVAV